MENTYVSRRNSLKMSTDQKLEIKKVLYGHVEQETIVYEIAHLIFDQKPIPTGLLMTMVAKKWTQH